MTVSIAAIYKQQLLTYSAAAGPGYVKQWKVQVTWFVPELYEADSTQPRQTQRLAGLAD